MPLLFQGPYRWPKWENAYLRLQRCRLPAKLYFLTLSDPVSLWRDKYLRIFCGRTNASSLLRVSQVPRATAAPHKQYSCCCLSDFRESTVHFASVISRKNKFPNFQFSNFSLGFYFSSIRFKIVHNYAEE